MGTVAATYGYLGSNADTSLWKADARIDSPLALLALLKKSPRA
jgi:phosphoglycolate phosphatase